MKSIAYYDGKIGAPEELMVPFNDRVHFFGDGCYDATVGANGKVYLLQDHLDRFFTSAKALDINIPMSKAELGRLLTDLLAKVDSKVNFVYWQVTRGVEPRNHVYEEGVPGKLWVSIRPNTLNDPDKPIRLNSEEDTRFYHCNIKTLNLLPSVMTAQRAKLAGMSETVFHRGDIVTECAHSNVSVLKDGIFYSHPNDELILRGIAKTHMLQACYRLGEELMHRRFGKPKKKAPAKTLWAKRAGVFVLWTISMVFFCVGMSGAGLTAGDAFAYLGGWFTGWSPARFGAELYGAAYNGFYANTIMVAAYYAFVVVTLALGFALDARRAFTYKNKPSEICLANEKHRWGIYYVLVICLLVGYIMQNGGFGGASGFGMYANF